jgi:membrane-bound ClpP family serine protease
MSWILVLVVLLVGLAALFAEFFLFPGLTISGIFGVLCLMAGIYLGYQSFDTTTGHLIFLSVLVLGSAVFYKGVQRLSQPDLAVSEALEGRVGEREASIQLGDRGRALSDLRPGGTALLGQDRLEVFSQGPFIDAGTPIEVVRLNDQRVYVAPWTNPQQAAPPSSKTDAPAPERPAGDSPH